MNNPKSWLIWFGAIIVVALVTRNPLYAIILLAIARFATETQVRSHSAMKLPLARVAIIILFFSVIYNALFIHAGDHILTVLPNWSLVGGAITYEAIVDGARNGLMLATLLAIFVAFNAIIPTSDLVRMIPPALKDIGVVVLVAITYVPETRLQLNRIREAQAIRGHQLRGLKDWRPVLVPLLVAGFERSLRLSEAMVARGYGSVRSVNHGHGKRLILIFSMILALAGWVLLLSGHLVGWAPIAGAVTVLIFIVLSEDRGIRRTKYRNHSWKVQDRFLVLASALCLAIIFGPFIQVDWSTLSYSPYEELALPAFDPFIGLALALLAIPVLVNVLKTVDPGKDVHVND